jgi:L-ascorbate metabolism protein UlaG (beta-lactamase superfamily)
MTGTSTSDATGILTWVGHSTVLVDVAGVRVLTDPLLTRRVAHLRRRRSPVGPDVADVDVVLISHAHMDHLHLPSLRLVRPGARVVVPAGLAGLVDRRRFHVTEVEIGDRVDLGPVAVDVVPAAHGHGRGPHSRVRARPVGYVIEGGGARVYVAGDTDLFDEMADLERIDVAVLPIWGWGRTIGDGHLDPERATTAVERIGPRLVVPMHWGTYSPEDGRRRLPGWFDEPAERFADVLAGRGLDDRLRLVEPAGSVILPGADR